MNANPGEVLERWPRLLPFAIFLALALGACFPGVLTGGESFFFRDYGVLGYPNIHFQRACFWNGELPFWNPYSNCGQPFLAQWGTMALYPFSLIYLLLPLPWSLSLFCFLHVWLGGLGLYLLVRHWTKTNFAAALAGTLFVFNGVMFSSFIWPNYLVALGWMPFVVLLVERAWREGGRLVVGAALVSALQMGSGAPEVILLTWLIVGALWLLDLVRVPKAALTFFLRIGGVVLLVSGLMAAQLLPFFELLQHSHRDPGFGTAKWQLPLWGWANFLVPMFNAFETPQGQYFQYGQAFLSSVYLGGVALVFVLIGLGRWPDARLWVLFVLAALGVALAFGDETPLYPALRKVMPLLGVARYPVKFLFLAAFVVPVLAGCGLAAVIRSRQRGPVYAAGFLVLATMVMITWAAREHRFVDTSAWPENFRINIDYSWNKPGSGQALPDAVVNTAWRGGFLVISLVALLLALRAKTFAKLFAVASLALIVADVRMHTPGQNPTLPAPLFTQRSWPDSPPVPRLGEGRILIAPQAEDFLTFVSSTNAQRVWEVKRRAEWSNLNLLDAVAKVNGSSTLQVQGQRQLEQTLYSMTNRLPAGLLDFLGVAYISSSNSAAEWSPRPTALALVTAGQQPVFAGEDEVRAGLTNRLFDPRQVVFLPPTARELVPATNSVTALLSNVRVTPRSVEADVEADGPTLVVIAQSHYPAWKATLDGETTLPLLQANGAFQAVPVPAGKHRIQLTYVDAKFKTGAVISAAFVLFCIFLWLRPGRSHSA